MGRFSTVVLSGLCVLAPVAARAEPLNIEVVMPRSAMPSRCYDCHGGRLLPSSYIVDKVTPPPPDRPWKRAQLREKLLKAAGAMTPDALYAQGLALYKAGPRELDSDVGVQIMELAAERGHVPAQIELIDIFAGRGLVERSDYWRERVAAGGTPVDWRELARLLATRGTAVADAHALGWYNKAAVAGDAEAQFALGQYYGPHYGEPPQPRDDGLAVYWYRRAGDGGMLAAMLAVGRIEADASSPAYDAADAIGWFLRAEAAGAQSGNQDAEHALCQWSTQAPTEARKAAMAACVGLYDSGKLGNYVDIRIAGAALFDGDLVAQDYARAWAALTTDGQRLDPYRRGRMLVDGLGVAADPELGRILIGYAARHHDADAATWIAAHPQPAVSGGRELDLNTLPGGSSYSVRVRGGTGNADVVQAAIPTAVGAMASDFYPERAVDDEVEGDGLVVCTWSDQGAAKDCHVEAETPLGYGFGKTTAKLLEGMTVTTEPDGAWAGQSQGKWSAFEVSWRLGG